ncbi:MAG: methylmalonyl-CoA epimerase [Chloroflexi bacterium 13_1_40CM_4_68_4]|nr:MAG: methylmalonyl-CoA epimerase [Chloroflexi bacterium 13_1_40CM_4_68_4]
MRYHPPRRVESLHHVAIVVQDLDAALALYRLTLGLDAREVKDVPDQGVRIAFLPLSGVLLELVQPTTAESGIARFLAERGRSTLHHVCFAVDDLATTLRELEASGVELVDHVPRLGAEGEVAFLHPRAADGVLIELIDRATISVKP